MSVLVSNLRKLLVKPLLKPLWRVFVQPFVSQTLGTKVLYWIMMGRHLNLAKPEDFNEKVQWLKLNWQHPLITKCADKYEIRGYATGRGCEDVLNELYGVYDRASDIPWESLPKKFALKCTHGCGYNIICDDKEKVSKLFAWVRLAWWTNSSYGRRHAEYHYLSIKSRIICERYIETSAGFLPNDYKIYCFNGRPHYVAVAIGRATRIKWHFLDIEWKRIDIALPEHTQGDLPVKPDSWDRMIEVAVELSQPFPFVRVDFYDDNGRAVLGEMTFTPAAGLMKGYYTEAGLKYVGGLLRLPEVCEEKSGIG